MRGDLTRALLVTAALGLGIGGMPVPGGAVAVQETAPPVLSSPVKGADEIAAIREAQVITDRVYAGIRPLVRAGVRESEVKAEIVRRIAADGAEVGFPPIVASGPHGALTHGSDEDRVMQDGELVVIDMGAKVRGYHTDMTRTVPIGTPTEEMRQAVRAVKAAQEAVLDAVKPGVRVSELDAVARAVLAQRGQAWPYRHALGHGVGLAIHENPRLSASSVAVVQAGMVIAVEPGVYIPDVGGVRVEDVILVTDTGYERLGRSEQEEP